MGALGASMTTVLCWDIDGTLLTTRRAGIFALEEAAREVLGVDADLQQLRTAGLTDYQIAVLVVERFGHSSADDTAQRAAALLRAYEHHLPSRLHWRRGRVLPGVREILDAFAADPDVWSIVLTGNTPSGARAKLAHYSLDGLVSPGGCCADGDDRGRIARRALRAARDKYPGIDAAQLVVIGDTPADVRCGKSIGARTVAIASGSHTLAELRDAGATHTLAELPAPADFAALLGLYVREIPAG